jgi:hypothetical protein
MGDFYDIERVDGNLLQLLAQSVGWQTDFTLPVSKQRNEVRFASHFYRTTGIPANLRAMVNRITTWDAVIKEIAHNIFRSNDPEQLAVTQMKRQSGVWQPSTQTTLDVAHEGRVGAREQLMWPSSSITPRKTLQCARRYARTSRTRPAKKTAGWARVR